MDGRGGMNEKEREREIEWEKREFFFDNNSRSKSIISIFALNADELSLMYSNALSTMYSIVFSSFLFHLKQYVFNKDFHMIFVVAIFPFAIHLIRYNQYKYIYI